MTERFEGACPGEGRAIADDARLECGICWWTYDPAVGDAYWQVSPGTPFVALPAHWSCPNCDAPKHRFMVLHEA
jgi:rubredoxin